jgi:hypothetical protein
MRLDATHVRLQKKKKKGSQDSSVPLDVCCESNVSPKRGPPSTSLLSHISCEDPMAKARARPSTEECKSKALHKVWYEFQASERAPRLRFAVWNDLLSEFSVNFTLMWDEVVSKELAARSALATWRRYPCKRIGSVLPAGFASWSAFLAEGGIRDPTTGTGSLSAYDTAHFWNDQCTCAPSCWTFASAPVPDPDPPAKRAKLPCLCDREPCACATVVSRTKDDELASLKTMRKLLPFGTKALDARINELESSRSRVPAVKLGDVLRADKALEHERSSLRVKKAEEDELARKCFAFWWTLEQQFALDQKRSPSSSVELLRWFWAGRGTFVQAFRKRVGKSALQYL